MMHQLMDPRREYLGNYRCADGCQKLKTSARSGYTVIGCTNYTVKHFQI